MKAFTFSIILRIKPDPRSQYELIWIEYYDRRAEDIDNKLKECVSGSKPPPVDRWVLMRVPREVYYHKHLMYNAGIVLSRGEIVAICDSDAIVKDTFVEAILEAFKQDPNIVLHLDQVRKKRQTILSFQLSNNRRSYRRRKHKLESR